MLELFPETALVEDRVLSVGGITAAALADRFGTPLVVFCERTIRTRAQAYRAAAPQDAHGREPPLGRPARRLLQTRARRAELDAGARRPRRRPRHRLRAGREPARDRRIRPRARRPLSGGVGRARPPDPRAGPLARRARR